MNLKEIKDIIKLMNENDLTEIEVEREGAKIKLRKGVGDMPEIITKPAINYAPERQPVAPASDEGAKSSNPNAVEINSPMVGSFYRSPSPESPPFVDVGDTVEVGQVVCIVEAMKLMNEIKSEVRGKVVECLVDNAQPVEFGQILFTVEPI